METLSPRKKLGAVPAAFEAGKLDGVDSTSFVRSDEADTIAANFRLNPPHHQPVRRGRYLEPS